MIFLLCFGDTASLACVLPSVKPLGQHVSKEESWYQEFEPTAVVEPEESFISRIDLPSGTVTDPEVFQASVIGTDT
jgi:hypothetical protein